MGFFQQLNESVSTAETKKTLAESFVADGKAVLTEHADWSNRFSKLATMMESADELERRQASVTAQVMANLDKQINKAKTLYDEATFSSMLGPTAMLTPRVLDVVGIFYPNMIAHLVTDIHVMDRSTGEVFVLRPRYGNDYKVGMPGGVSAGMEMWVNQTDGGYASEYTYQSATAGTTDGSTVDFTVINLGNGLRRGSVTVKLQGVTVARDDCHGNLVGRDREGNTISGTVDYANGIVNIHFSAAPSAGKTVVADAYLDSENDPSLINEINFDIQALPVTARVHPLRYAVSAHAQLLAAAHIDVDVNEVLTNIAAAAIKQERDVMMVNTLVNAATHLPTLDFDLTDTTAIYRNKRDRFADIILKVNEAQTQIQMTAGRGGVSFIVAGPDAANIFRCVEDFEVAPEAQNAAVGPYKMGALRNGSVPVICVPKSICLGKDEYVVGFRGYQTGDSATILAEWIPLYFTALWEAPDLINKRGLMSLYDLQCLRPDYLVKGKVIGYNA